MHKFDLIVIGAGISGLAAARRASLLGNKVIILEKENLIGGRIKSEYFENCILDYGFQVVLPGYPSLKRLNLDLNLKYFDKGANIFINNDKKVFIDPLKHPISYFINFNKRINSFIDLIKLIKIIFKTTQIQTVDVIQNADFSKDFKEGFLLPFLRGILLDHSLSIPWNRSAFYLKTFLFGGAALPENGMQSLPNELAKCLDIRLEKEVVSIDTNTITCSDGSTFEAKNIIQTAPNLINLNISWLKTSCYYFLYSGSVKLDKKLALFANAEEGKINHVANLSEVSESYSPKGTSLLSVSTLEISELSEEEIKKFLCEKFNLSYSKLQYLKKFIIKEALPKEITNLTNKINNGDDFSAIMFAGDSLPNNKSSFASQHAAITSGETASLSYLKP
jgi:hypothetical protein